MNKDYNTTANKLVLPAYGRNVQNMVEHCLTIEDREERQNCAETIIKIMSTISSADRAREDFEQVLWDHLYIMSDFKLDVDFPYEVTTRDEYTADIDRSLDNDHQRKPKYRHYGRNIERMITIALREEDEDKRLELTKEIAVQMKRDYINWNKDTVANSRIFADLYELSKGQLYLDEMIFDLPDARDLQDGPSSSSPKKGHNNNRKRKR